MPIKQKLKIVSLINNDLVKKWETLTIDWKKYFNVQHIIANPSQITEFTKKKIDILFIDAKDFNKFKFEYYENFKNKESLFKFIVIKRKSKIKKDWIFLKNLADDIVFINNKKFAKWKTLVNLRRYWDTYSKPTTIIYKGIIANFIDSFVSVEGVKKDLTTKEFCLLKYFLENINIYLSKDNIFKKVWKINDKDSTRVVDQILFKLKRKIGKEYFTISRQKGIKFK